MASEPIRRTGYLFFNLYMCVCVCVSLHVKYK
jgi:hypothetical protein